MKHEEYISKVKKVFPNYKILSEYTKSSDPIKVRCKDHDETFELIATRLTQGQTCCSQCKVLMKEDKSEHDIQEDFVTWFRNTFPDTLITCNGIFTNRSQVNNAVVLGYCKGIPDIFIPEHKMFIEFKAKKGRVSKDQRTIMAHLEKIGYECYICRSAEEAMDLFKK
jgi:hypothetical protein